MVKKNRSNVLVIAAHPDDEVLGCGGVMAKYSGEKDIYIIILGEGISSRHEKREDASKEELLGLQSQSIKVGKLLGAKANLFFNFPDNRFDTVPFLDIVKKIEEIIGEIRPEVIYTHHFGDLNIDHRITFRAVLTATRPINNCSAKEIYSFEIPSSTEWSYQKIENPFVPNVYEDISDTFKKKIEAMGIYQKELREFPHPRSLKGIEIFAQKRGVESGLEYAEAFELIKWTK